jgi:hypothetical protein
VCFGGATQLIVSHIQTIGMSENRMNLYQAVCLYSLKGFPPHYWPEIALGLVEQGETSESLEIIAGISSSEYNYFDFQLYFERMLNEFGITIPTEEIAFREIAKYYTIEFLNGRLKAIEYGERVFALHQGLREQYKDTDRLGDFFGIQHIIKIYNRYDDVSERLAKYNKEREIINSYLDQEMQKAARELAKQS